MERSGQNNQSDGHDKEEQKASSADSGLSQEDFSIISSGTSDFSLLETSSGKEKENEEQRPSAVSNDGIQQDLQQEGACFVEKTEINENKFRESKVSAGSSTADISILDIPADDELDVNDIEEDSCAKNKFNFINLPVGKKSESETDQFISHSRPKDQSNHESSELGSSFSIIEDFKLSSSYPPSFDDSVDKSKIKVLPPKSSIDTELSTSMDENGQKITKKKSIHGGIVEIVVPREDWKQDETEKLLRTDGEDNLNHGERTEETKLEESIDTKVVAGIDSAVHQSTGDVDTDFETDRQKDKQGVNTNDASGFDIDEKCKNKLSESDEVKEEVKNDETKIQSRTDNNLPESKKDLKADNDPNENQEYTRSQNEACEVLDHEWKHLKNGDIKNRIDKDEVESPQDQNSSNDQRLTETHTSIGQQGDNDPLSAKHNEKSLEFSIISNTEVTEEKMSKYFGKSDVDSDRLSTNSESSSNGSTSSVEIHMEEPIVETSSEDTEFVSSDRSRASTKGEDEIDVDTGKESFININKECIDTSIGASKSHDVTGATPEGHNPLVTTPESQIGISSNDNSDKCLHEDNEEQLMDADNDLTAKNTKNQNLEKVIPAEMDAGEEQSFMGKSYDNCSFKLRPKNSMVTGLSEQNLQREITTENGSETDVKYVSLPSTGSKTEMTGKMLENGFNEGDVNRQSLLDQQQDQKVTKEEEFVVVDTENSKKDLLSETDEEGSGTKEKLLDGLSQEPQVHEAIIPDSQENELGSTNTELSDGKDPSTRTDFGKTDDKSVEDYSLLNAPELETDRKDSSSSVTSEDKQQTGPYNVNNGRSPSVSDVSTSESESPDVWQPVEGLRMTTEDEQKVSQSFSKKYEMDVSLRYFKSSDKNRSHESEVKMVKIQMGSELELAKWTYVLTRKDKLLKDKCPNTSISFDVSYSELDLIRYDTTDDPIEIEKWYSEVIEKVKQEVAKISSCLICCLPEVAERVLSMVEKICSVQNLDLDFEHNRSCISPSSNESTKEDVIKVTGQPNDVAMVMLEMDGEQVKLYQLQGNHLVSLTPCKFPINNVQHDVFTKFDGHMSLDREFPSILSVIQQDSLKLLVQTADVKRVISVLFTKWLKFKDVSKVMLKPSEFSLLCKTSVKDFIMTSKLDPLGYDYRWTLKPADREIILYTENREQADEIRDAIYSSFHDYLIKLNDVEMDYIRNSDKWTKIFDDVQKQSDGMAEIGLHNDHSVVILTGTDDLMAAWEKYGTLTSIEKHIKDIVKNTEKVSLSKTEPEMQVKKFVQIDGDKLDTILEEKNIEIKGKCDDKNVQIVATDIGFEVIGGDEMKVKEICDYLLQLGKHISAKQKHTKDIKKFVQMDECDVDMVCAQKSDILESYSRKLEVDYDMTNLGFEVRGKTERNVKEFCDVLLEMKQQVARQQTTDQVARQQTTDKVARQQTTDQVARHQNEDNGKLNGEKGLGMYEDSTPISKVVRFFQLDDRAVRFIDKYKMVELREIMANMEVNLSKTTVGFEVRGSAEIDVKTILERLMNLKSQIETRRIQNVSKLRENDLQKLEQKYKCIVKLLADRDDACKLLDDSDVEDAAVWHINGVKVSVTMKDAGGLVCDVIVRPMDEKIKEIRKGLYTSKKFQYQEKHMCDEVEIPAPLYTQDAGKQKHELTELFSEMLTDLNKKDYGIVALPVNNFNGWPYVKLTKVMMSSFIEFCRLTQHHSIQKMKFFSEDATVCQKVIEVVKDALSGLEGDNLIIGLVKKSAQLIPVKQTEPTKVEKDDLKDEKPPPLPEKDYPKPKTPPPEVHLKPEIVVIKGVIAHQDVNAIVNTTSQDFDLKNGAVSKSILDMAGKEIQKEINKAAKHAKPGDLVVTGGYKLKCRAVFHGALQCFDKRADKLNQNGVKVLETFIMNCLTQAHIRKYKSIAFPVLGAGALEFPVDLVATVMIETVEKFRKKIPNSKLSEVRVVVYREEGIYMVFKKMADCYRQNFLKEMAPPTLPLTPKAAAPVQTVESEDLSKDKPPVSPDLPTQGINLDLGVTCLSASLGDVTKLTEFDCLILLWPQDEINAPSTDKETILNSVGHSSLTQWETGKDSLSDSKVLVTPGGALPQKTIIHVCVDNHNLQKAFELGLNKADELKMSSAVIPVRPTDQLAQDVVKFSSCIYKAVTEKCNQLISMRHVRVCIGGKHLCQPILATLAKLHETTESVNANMVQPEESGSITVEITALKDDMNTIIAEINPNTLKEVEIEEINEVKDKTLTKEDIDLLPRQQTKFLVNVRAEIDPEIIEAVRQRNQLDMLKRVVERSSEHVKLVEQGAKWLIHGSSFTDIETCIKNVQEFWDKIVNGRLDQQTGAENPTDTKTVIKVDITKDLFNALMLLMKKKLSSVIGEAKIQFLEKSGSLEIVCKDFDKEKEQNIKRIISGFQTNMVMDVVEVPYQRLSKDMKKESFVIKLQTEYPDVYIYSDSGNEAEPSFNVYIISLSRDNLKSAKQGIQTEYLKTSTRTGRFTQSQIRDKKSSFQGRESFTRSYSHQERTPKPKHFLTAEGLSISIYMADIRSLPVDCIVNAANGHLLHGGGVAAIIADAAGRGFNKECQDYVKSYGQIQIGECCVTNAGNLPYKRVIHGVGPQWSPRKMTECCDLLQKTIEQCIQTANAHGMKSVAIPSISAGLYGMPAEICAKCYAVGVMTVSSNRTGHWPLEEIHFVDNKPDMVFKVQAAFAEFFENSGTTRQRSVEEQFHSLTTVDQFREDKTFFKKLVNNESISKTEALVKGTPVVDLEPRETTVKLNSAVPASEENVQHNQPPCRFLINQNLLQHDHFSDNFKLPSSWLIIIKRNLIEIQASPNFKIYIFERDFTKLVSESVAFGQDTDWERRSSLVKSAGANKDLKDKLRQLKVQLPEPAVGTIASFDMVNGVNIQNVFVVFTPRYTETTEKRKFHGELMGCYLKLFNEASKMPDVDVLAVSFLKTGNKGIQFKEGADIFLQAVSTFTARMKPDCTLKQINLILNKRTNAIDNIKFVIPQRSGNKDEILYVDEKVDKQDIAMLGHKITNENSQDDKTEHAEKGDGKSEGSADKEEPEDCAICLEVIQETDKKILEKCKHKFCKECIEQCFKHRPVCPTCGTVYGVVIGNQPKGTMHVNHIPKKHLPGYAKHGHYVITYSFQDGVQTEEHHNPGQRYRGTYRTAYLPDNDKGTLVMKLLKIAFDRKLVFTIGHSRTTGEENVVTWNDVHHKTCMYGGQQGFGYPDPEYLDRVLDELAAKGVTKEDLK